MLEETLSDYSLSLVCTRVFAWVLVLEVKRVDENAQMYARLDWAQERYPIVKITCLPVRRRTSWP